MKTETLLLKTDDQIENIIKNCNYVLRMNNGRASSARFLLKQAQAIQAEREQEFQEKLNRFCAAIGRNPKFKVRA